MLPIVSPRRERIAQHREGRGHETIATSSGFDSPPPNHLSPNFAHW
jgi:hypothetical protein